MQMKNSGSMKAKILCRFGMIVLILLIVGGLFAASTKRIKDAQDYVTNCTADKMLLQKAVADHFQWTISLNSAINYGKEFTGSTDSKSCEFGRFLYSEDVQGASDWADFIKNIEPLHDQIHAGAVEILSQTDLARSKELYWNNIRPTLDELVAQLNDYIQVQSGKVQIAEQSAARLVDFQMAAIIVQVVILFILLVNTYCFIRRDVVLPVLQIRKNCDRLAQGQLSLDFNTDCKNTDIRQLCDALNRSVAEIKKYIDDIDRAMSEISSHNFNIILSQPFIGDFKSIEVSINKMTDDLSNELARIDSSAGLVSNGSTQVSSGAQTLAQGSTEQASSIEELSATIMELDRQIQQNADNADKASKMATGATAAISASNEQMQKLMSSMREMEERAKEIRKIIKTITDIAFQTNVLALNAAVESARAGAAGKGFAVVANEVRSLAAKSSEAAQSTTALIESSAAATRQGVELAKITSQDLLQVVDGANETTAVITEIAEATRAQAHAVSQLMIGLEQISSVVQQNAATAEESAAASEELSSQAQILKNSVDLFELKKGGSVQTAEQEQTGCCGFHIDDVPITA